MDRPASPLVVRRRGALLAAPALVAASGARAQQDFPNRPVSIVVASPAGGGTDFSARLVSEPLAQRLGAPVVVENRPGGNGALGLIHVARSRPDGHTLAVGYSGTMTGRPAVEGVGDLDPQRDFAPVGQITSTPQAMMCHPSVPARTMGEFIAHAKARPGQLNYASAGNGSLHHLGTELLKRRAGIDLAHIPYRGTGETISDLLAGRVQFYMNSPPPVLPFLRDGRLRPLATTGRERHPALPEVPCLAELGFDDFPVDVWYALYAPSRTPQPVLDRLARELRAVLAEDAVRRRAEDAGTFVRHTDAAAVAARLKRETEGWVELVRAVGIKPD